MPGATPNTRTNTTLFCAYDLAVTLTGSLRLEAAPLKHLPLVVCDSHANQASYAFPSPATGRWLLNQKATEASTFMARWLLTHHRGILSTHICHALSTSLQFAHTLLRCLRPSLPNMQIMQDMWSSVRHRRVPFKDGWLDTNTLQFHPLPYPRHLLVTQPALSITYQELMAVGEADLQEATHVLNMYFPADAEREWLLRFLGRCLALHDCCKVLVCMTDSLGDDDMPGNAVKTTLLNWLQSVLGSCNCSMQSGQALTLGHSASSTHASEPQHISAPLLRCFDEVSHTNSTSCAHQLNYGQLKYLTAGRNTQPAVLIAANVHNGPNLTNLQERDPALTSRLVMLPARGRFNQTPGQGTVNIQEKLYALAPAFARLLVDAFAAYKTSGNQLLPFLSSMILFKQLVIHSSALHTFCTSDVAATRD